MDLQQYLTFAFALIIVVFAGLFGLAGGEKVTVSENRRGWLKVTDDQGRTGWVYKDYLN